MRQDRDVYSSSVTELYCKADQQSDVHDGECRAKKHRKSGGLKYSYEVLAYIVDIVRVSVP